LADNKPLRAKCRTAWLAGLGAISGTAAILFAMVALTAPAVAAPAQPLPVELPATAKVGDAKRVALVIGNGAYRNVPTLRNTINDARAVAAKLQESGFDVLFARDVDRLGLNQTIARFLSRIEPGSEAVVYYAGHGVEVQGSNYLLPIDIPELGPDEERLLRSEAVNLTDLLLDLESRQARVSLVILDACRDNPFQARATTRSLGTKRGLGRVDPPRGSFVIFSAGVGEEALDNLGPADRDPNGLFTRRLLKLISVDGLELRAMVRQLRIEVREAALAVGSHNQIPSYYDQRSVISSSGRRRRLLRPRAIRWYSRMPARTTSSAPTWSPDSRLARRRCSTIRTSRALCACSTARRNSARCRRR
jgi:caspase domain-containing protein